MSGRARRDAEFTDFVERASAELLRIAWYLTGDVHRANDLVQASLVKTYLSWPRVEQSRAVAYARRIMLNRHTDSWRRTRAEVLVDNITDLDCGGSVDEAGAVDTTQALVGPCARCPRSSGRRSSSGTIATCPSARWPRSWASASAPSRATPPVVWKLSGCTSSNRRTLMDTDQVGRLSEALRAAALPPGLAVDT